MTHKPKYLLSNCLRKVYQPLKGKGAPIPLKARSKEREERKERRKGRERKEGRTDGTDIALIIVFLAFNRALVYRSVDLYSMEGGAPL